MGSRGQRSGGGLYGRTQAQDRALKQIAKRTANLKNEQMRIVDADGNTVLEKKGDRHSVAATVGEKRQYMEGNVSIHNHPDGGTFSPDDLSDFGYGAKEMVVATPEGTYRLVNTRYGKPDAKSGWYDMRENITQAIPETSFTDLRRQARNNTQNTAAARGMKQIENRWASIKDSRGNDAAASYYAGVKEKYDALTKRHTAEIQAEQRRLEVKPFHDFYKANAKKYGFEYRFEKNR